MVNVISTVANRSTGSATIAALWQDIIVSAPLTSVRDVTKGTQTDSLWRTASEWTAL